ncbi:membrane protein insertion efficiency factor YidD [Actinocorallia populi]|uniref:membrane protein insertion efficiency factor YidD n=1 Tax=Actinocorallia populi TaxID=2079200 RepID=UPI000D0915F3|nr:membrane protein insertion efficiency factor YidD [Actinocorallia populi]
MSRRPGPIAWTLIGFVRFYRRFVSPLLPPTCRFEPSCSTYGLTALQTHGALHGFWLTVARVGRCHPFHPGGYDPVPEPRTRTGRGEASGIDHPTPEPADPDSLGADR